ncbi:MAG: glucokinase [Gammaproteobacteria bacterium]|nr:glucokinase [Gammaproteobacteria bacterium]
MLVPSLNTLIGDIGGTNTRLMYLGSNGDIKRKTYPSQQYSDLITIVQSFIEDYKLSIERASFGVAGPVFDEVKAKVTNLPWHLEAKEFEQKLSISKVKFINDFMAVGYGIELLSDEDYCYIHDNKTTVNNPNAAIIGAGTGLGVAHRVFIEGQYRILTSETGHSGFSPENNQQLDLHAWLLQSISPVSMEMLLSGPGLVNIFRYFSYINYGDNYEQNIADILSLADPAKYISESGLNKVDEVCEQALNCFVDIYASAIGDIALHYYPIEEIYIAGGIAAKIKSKLVTDDFVKHMHNKGKMSENLSRITIKLVEQGDIGLYGALNYIIIQE